MCKINISLSKPTGNFWIDNGIVVLAELFGEGEFEVEHILNKLLSKLVTETGNEGEYYDAQTNTVKIYQKKNWIYPTNLFIKSTPQADKIKINNKIHFLSPPQYSLKLEFLKKSDVCDVCGNTGLTTDAKMWMFPFTVAPDKFSNFYSGLKRGIKLCPRCALAGLAGYLGWLWKAQGRDKLHIFIFYSDLKTMLDLRKHVLKPLEYSQNSRGGNIPLEFSGLYIHETALGLILRLFRELQAQEGQLDKETTSILKELFDEFMEGKPLTLFAFSGNPGKAFNMESATEFSEFKTLYQLYLKWLELFKDVEGRPHEIVVNAFKQFQKKENNNWNTIWRDKIAWAVLELKDPAPFIEEFLFETKNDKSGPLLFGTLDILELYWKEVIGMDEKLLNVLKGFGHNLGRVAQVKNEMGLLYTLRNAKNADDFYKVLNDIQFRLELTVPEDILQIGKGEKIKGNPWLRVKTLLSIYAMNSYLLTNKKSENQEVNL